LTRRQEDILAVLRRLETEQCPPPTLDELCALLGLRSRGSLHKHIRSLIELGALEPIEGRHRGIRLASDLPGEQGLPLLGKIAAGKPIEAIADPEHIDVPASLRTDKTCYVLTVEGDSMREAGILDGDYVVIEQRTYARNGEIVVALIDGEAATLKRILQQPDRVILYPENSAMEAMEYHPDRVSIQGVLVGQMRVYR
jgi:repressor LexA